MEDILKVISGKLQEIEEQENVRILHAVESGSRAWGFASPDSDYDVRFLYVRNQPDYLALNEKRDVIEWQLDEVLDINGWDLKKTLIQFHRGNATLFEWSNSPIVYRTTDEWKQIEEAAGGYFSIKAAMYHYYGTAVSTYSQYLQGKTVNYKKYFYALRPLLAGEYIKQHSCPPPVLFDELMKMDMTSELRSGIEKLLEIKKSVGEEAAGEPVPVIQDFITGQIASQKAYVDSIGDDRNADWENLNQLFRKIIL